MSKINVEEFDECYKFWDKIQLFCLKKFGDFSMTHYVADNDFSFFFELEPGTNIKEMINYIKTQLLKVICIVTTGKCIDHWLIPRTIFFQTVNQKLAFLFQLYKTNVCLFSQLYCDYIESIKKSWITDLKKKDVFVEMRIRCNFLVLILI